MIDKLFRKVLILSPHVDDGELGCGGTISKLLREGCEVHYLAFSAAERSVRPGFPKDILRKELKNASKVWGLKEEHVNVLKYDVRHFKQARQEILEDLIKTRKELQPDLVFIPSTLDVHQDHQVISEEAIRAFKGLPTSILGYELVWNTFTFRTEAFVTLEEKDIQKKLDVLKEYKTQQHRNYLDESFIRGIARTRGVQNGTTYAEAFEVIRWVIR